MIVSLITILVLAAAILWLASRRPSRNWPKGHGDSYWSSRRGSDSTQMK